MATTDSFVDLMSRLQTDEDAAARILFERFARRLIGLARLHLDARLAAKVDPEDVVQSAYKSFFLRQREAEWTIDGWDSLWGLFALITVRKCVARREMFHADKRDVRREGSASVAGELLSEREPAPEEVLMLRETVEQMFRDIDDPDERKVLELSLQGYSASEISEQLGRAERTVRRFRERSRQRLMERIR